jgi:hypothetical protein
VATFGPDPPCRYRATGYRLTFVQFWRDPVLDNGTVGPNYFCKSIGEYPGLNNKAENISGTTAVRPGKTRRRHTLAGYERGKKSALRIKKNATRWAQIAVRSVRNTRNAQVIF